MGIHLDGFGSVTLPPNTATNNNQKNNGPQLGPGDDRLQLLADKDETKAVINNIDVSNNNLQVFGSSTSPSPLEKEQKEALATTIKLIRAARDSTGGISQTVGDLCRKIFATFFSGVAQAALNEALEQEDWVRFDKWLAAGVSPGSMDDKQLQRIQEMAIDKTNRLANEYTDRNTVAGQLLLSAVREKDAAFMKFLINNDIGVADALLDGNKYERQELLSAGANVNACIGETTVLSRATKRGDMALAEALLEKKADVNSRGVNGKGARPIEYALNRGKADFTELLLKHGADVKGDQNVGIQWKSLNDMKKLDKMPLMEHCVHYARPEVALAVLKTKPKDYEIYLDTPSTNFNDLLKSAKGDDFDVFEGLLKKKADAQTESHFEKGITEALSLKSTDNFTYRDVVIKRNEIYKQILDRINKEGSEERYPNLVRMLDSKTRECDLALKSYDLARKSFIR